MVNQVLNLIQKLVKLKCANFQDNLIPRGVPRRQALREPGGGRGVRARRLLQRQLPRPRVPQRQRRGQQQQQQHQQQHRQQQQQQQLQHRQQQQQRL